MNAGTLSVTGTIAGGAVVNNGGTLNGTGTIGGGVIVNSGGIFSPGLSPGTITIGGLTMMSGGTLNAELSASGSDHINITSGGSASLAGTLNIILLDGYTPPLGSQFNLFSLASHSGDFTSYTGLNFGGNLALRPTFTATSLMLNARPTVDGDINLDGTVNIFDINNVSSNWGTAGPQGDANGDGIVNIFDVNLISSNWGATDATAVPEPATADPGAVRPAWCGLLARQPTTSVAARQLAIIRGERLGALVFADYWQVPSATKMARALARHSDIRMNLGRLHPRRPARPNGGGWGVVEADGNSRNGQHASVCRCRRAPRYRRRGHAENVTRRRKLQRLALEKCSDWRPNPKFAAAGRGS